MNNIIGVDAAKLAGLQIDLLQKIRSEQVTMEHLEWFTQLTRGERDLLCGVTNESRIIPIDRTAPFDPVKFISPEWSIDEQDERALAITEVDFAKVRLVSMLKKRESFIKGEERLKRLKGVGNIRLDAKVFQTLWENQSLIPESWKEKTDGNVTFIFFDGTVLRSPGGGRYVLYLYWDDGRWGWYYSWLEDDWSVDDPSAVLASI